MPSLVDVYDDAGQLYVMPSVYSLAFTETNDCFERVDLPRHLWHVTASRLEFDEALAGFGLGPLPMEGERKLGLLDLIHEPIVDGILQAVAPSLPGLLAAGLDNRYPLHGSSSGIGLLMSHLKNRLNVDVIHVLAGDYEGYAAQAENYGLTVRSVTLDEAALTNDATMFVSNPSAIDGEQLDRSFVEALCERNRVVFDVAYHGLHGASETPVPSGAWAVLWSLSKPWGLFWRRVGILACRDVVPAAYGTRWFKDPARLLAAHSVVTRFAPSAMSQQYRWLQDAAIESLAAAGVPATATSTVLLAQIARADVSDAQWDQLSQAQRRPGSNVARICLTPLMERILATDLARL